MSDEAIRRRVLDAHGDAWQAEGRQRTAHGGGTAEVRGARLMASGIAAAKWNNADVTAADADVEAIAAWYGERDVPWGVRVPLGIELDLGAPLFVKRCLYLHARDRREAPRPALELRRAAATELERFAAAEAAAFGDDLATAHRWLEPVFGKEGFTHWLALDDAGEAKAVATVVRTDERAGPAAMLTGVAGEAALFLAGAATEGAFDDGAELVHLHTAFEHEAAMWAGVGFREVPGFLVRVVRPD